jgi:hypothetical protein
MGSQPPLRCLSPQPPPFWLQCAYGMRLLLLMLQLEELLLMAVLLLWLRNDWLPLLL